MTTVAIVVALVVAAAIVLMLVRGRSTTQLQGPAPSAPRPVEPSAARRKEAIKDVKEIAEAKPAAPEAERRPPRPLPSAPQSLPSADLLPRDSSKSQLAAKPVTPPVPKDVAGLRKGLARHPRWFHRPPHSSLSRQEGDRPGHT